MLVGELVHIATLTRAHRTNSRAATTGPTSSIVTKRLSVGNDDLGNAGLVRRKPGIDTVNIVDDLATEVTDRVLIFGARHLRRVLAVYASRCNGRRPHRALRLRPPRPTSPVPEPIHGRIWRRPPGRAHRRV
jgi:hypothetical protein